MFDQAPTHNSIDWLGTAGLAALFTLIGVIVRQLVPFRKVRISEFEAVNKAQEAEISRLSGRIDTLEQKMDTDRERHEAQLAFERATHSAELSLQRHATRGAKQILYSMLDMIEAAPRKAAVHAGKVRARLIELEEAERTEAATINAAKIVAAAKLEDRFTPPANSNEIGEAA
jgi:hypothetical protein